MSERVISSGMGGEASAEPYGSSVFTGIAELLLGSWTFAELADAERELGGPR